MEEEKNYCCFCSCEISSHSQSCGKCMRTSFYIPLPLYNNDDDDICKNIFKCEKCGTIKKKDKCEKCEKTNSNN